MLLAVTRQHKVTANWDAVSLLADESVSPEAGCRELPCCWGLAQPGPGPGDRRPFSAAPAAMGSSKHQGLSLPGVQPSLMGPSLHKSPRLLTPERQQGTSSKCPGAMMLGVGRGQGPSRPLTSPRVRTATP